MLVDRIAGAPISWGICEVPGWGLQLPVPRVLAEMEGLGLRATEFGAVGWLPTDAAELVPLLEQHGLRLLGGFVPLRLHDAAGRAESRATADDVAATMAAAGAELFVTAVVLSPDDWRHRPLSDDEWDHLLAGLAEVDGIVAGHGLRQVVHPHVNTLIEKADDVDRLVAGCDLPLCLDTGHLAIGGTDPVRIATDHLDRVGLVHLKDVRLDLAAQVNDGHLTLMEAVQRGLFPPLGQGDVPIAEVVTILEASGYDGWYTIEQDVALTEGEPPEGEGPVRGVAASVAFLRDLAGLKVANPGPAPSQTQGGNT